MGLFADEEYAREARRLIMGDQEAVRNFGPGDRVLVTGGEGGDWEGIVRDVLPGGLFDVVPDGREPDQGVKVDAKRLREPKGGVAV